MMSTMKLLFCAACLCSAGVFVKSAMTQDATLKPVRSSGKDLKFYPDDAAVPKITAEPQGNEPPLSSPGFFEDDGESEAYNTDRTSSEPQRAGSRSRSRDPVFTPDPNGTISLGPLRPRTVRHTVTRTLMEPIPPEELEAMQKLQAAIQQLNTGKDDAERKAATETIQQQLTTQFEADLKQREKELAEVEQRVKSLREQLDKRKAAQADIINLRLQTLINDANGLGFPDTGFASGQPTVQDRAQAPLYQPGRTDETDAPSYDPGQRDSDVFSRDAVPESLQPLKPPLE